MTAAADRELWAEVHVDAPPARVWEVLVDLRRMSDWSPELVRMMPLLPGGLRLGQQYLGINRRGAVVWPTRNVVVGLDPGRVLAWETRSSGARWIWELAPTGSGTTVVHRRPVPRRLTRLSAVFATAFLGGSTGHADELEAGMLQTAERLRDAVPAAGD
ncbi:MULTISPECIES: SRPBCC family protein [unclassified Nocardioides]|uniref:SRPBCC family protein n=1 Tax=unclassified Nocardioides TaxID=2615069 RepID=UPI00301479CB